MIFADSSVWIDYFNGKTSPKVDKLDPVLGVELITTGITGDLILAEVLQGFRNDKDHKTAKNLLASLTAINMLDTTLAIKSAGNSRTLRK